ncbi:MAG: MarC family NAAT transporter [Deltaproteobacteria bacterium]|nr:MAG: MarC family NAAT transporter [Deltaproteobacteria bacterium]
MIDWLTIALGTFVSLLPIANPFSTAVVFLAITKRFSRAKREQQARMACVYMAAVLIVFLVAGALIMRFFGISLPGLRIAGGLIVARIGFGMLAPEAAEEVSDEAKDEALHMRDVAFTPLAVPMLSGPGSIAVTIGMAADLQVGGGEYAAIGVGIVLVAAVSWLVLRSARSIVHFLGVTGMNALSRIMGFLLTCVGVQFIVDGIRDAISQEAFLRPILELVRSLS